MIETYGRHQIFNDDIQSILKVLKSDYLTQGPVVEKFERDFSKKVDSNFALAVNSGTSALHLSCLALNLKKDDIFWTSPMSFVASSNCGIFCGAKVDFIDIDVKTGNLSIEELEKKLFYANKKNRLPKLIIVVHYAGNSPDLKKISNLSKKYKFKIIEDACHSLGGMLGNKKIGSCYYSDITTFSFHPVKNITSGEGGMITTNNHNISKKIDLLRTHGIEKNEKNLFYKNKRIHYYEQQLLGYNYRLSDIHAALGLSQLKKLNYFIKKRNRLAKIYQKNLDKNKVVQLFKDSNNISGMHIFVVKINNSKLNRDQLAKALKQKNVGTQIHYHPIHLNPFYRNLGFKVGDFPESEKFATQILTLPLHTNMNEQDIVKISNLVNKLL